MKGQNTLGLTYTDKVDGQDFNRVGALDGRILFSEYYSVTWQAGASSTRKAGTTKTAPMWRLTTSANSRKYTGFFQTYGYHDDFRAETGFLRRIGIVSAQGLFQRKFYGEEGDFVEYFAAGTTLDATWNYDNFTAGHVPDDRKLFLQAFYTFKGGWSGNFNFFYESYGYPPNLYSNYYVERHENGVPADTVAYSATDRLQNRGFWTTLQTPRWKTFSMATEIALGRDTNFFEWSSANILFVTLIMNWTPTEQLRFNLLYTHQQYLRASDNSLVGLRRVPRLKAEYQITPYLFVRVVGQYDSNFVDDLRDNSRTEDPILLSSPGAETFHRAVARRSNRLRVDWLLSYRPIPGTVFFLGYGAGMIESESFRFGNLQRQVDGFFIKLSYLFRV